MKESMQTKSINPLMKSSVLYLLAVGLGQGITFLGMIVFTRIMSKEDYGLYSTYYAVVSVMEVVVGANLYKSINNAYADFADRFHAYQKTIAVLSIVTLLGVSLIAVIVKGVFVRSVPWYIMVFMLIHAFSFFMINCGIYASNMENDYRRKTRLLFLPYLMQFMVALGFVLLFREQAYPARIAGSALGMFLCAAPVFILIIRYPGKLVVSDDWKYALAISVPSIAMSISYMLMTQCDKMVITEICGADETATYAVVFYLGYALLLINRAVSPVRQAWVFKNMKMAPYATFHMIQKWYLIGIGVFAAAILMIAPEAIRILAPRSYWNYEYIAPFVLSACLSITCEFYSEFAMYYKKTAILSVCVVIAAAVNIGLNLLMIPRCGAVAAAYTTVVAYLLQHILLSLAVRDQTKEFYSKRVFLVFMLFSTAICALFQMVREIPVLRYPAFCVIVGILSFYAIRKKDEWIAFVHKR